MNSKIKDHKIILLDNGGDEIGRIKVGLTRGGIINVLDIEDMFWNYEHKEDKEDTTVLVVNR